MFGLSKREIEKKFTRSEMMLLAWRSQETAFQLKSSSEVPGAGAEVANRKRYSDAQIPEGLPDRFFNKDGEVDLRQVTGEEAYRYLSSMGIKLPVMLGRR